MKINVPPDVAIIAFCHFHILIRANILVTITHCNIKNNNSLQYQEGSKLTVRLVPNTPWV